MVFKDQLVRCAACGTNFVYTVREQRRRAEAGQAVDVPAFCPDCQGADARLAEAAATTAPPVGRGATENRSPRPAGSSGGRPPRRGHDRRGAAPRGARPARGRPRPRQTELRFRYVGVVKWFDEDKGYGFIAQDEDSEEVFVHSSAIIVAGVRVLREGQPVEYELEPTPRGLQAVDVVPLA